MLIIRARCLCVLLEGCVLFIYHTSDSSKWDEEDCFLLYVQRRFNEPVLSANPLSTSVRIIYDLWISEVMQDHSSGSRVEQTRITIVSETNFFFFPRLKRRICFSDEQTSVPVFQIKMCVCVGSLG